MGSSAESFDLFVIGAGSGGVRAARFAAGFGARVAVAEEKLFGGTCVHAGCVPKKILVYGSEYAHAFEDARGFGWDVATPTHSWSTLSSARLAETTRLGGIYRRLLEQSGCTVLEGRATILSPHEVAVNGRTVRAEHILVATGSRATRLDVPGGELGMTSDDAFPRGALPRSIAVLGAGYIAVEFACIYRSLGAEVHLVHRGPGLLRGFDEDVRAHLRAELEKQGITLHLGETVRSIARANGGLRLQLSSGASLEVEDVLHAIGRTPNTSGLGLDAAGVQLGANGALRVDAQYRSNVPSILAVGDVIGHVQLTPVALAEGMYVARRYFGGMDPAPLDYDLIPSAVFSQPNVGTVGLTEEAARARGDVRVFRTTFRSLRHTISGRDEKILMKLVVDAATDRVLGVHVVGPDAGEIVQGFAVALTCGATKAQFDATIGIHPTAAEELVTLRG